MDASKRALEAYKRVWEFSLRVSRPRRESGRLAGGFGSQPKGLEDKPVGLGDSQKAWEVSLRV